MFWNIRHIHNRWGHSSHQTEAERLLDGLQQLELEPLSGLVARQIEQIEACMRHWQRLLVIGWLEVQYDRLHALYRNAIAARQEQQELLLLAERQLVKHLPEQPDLKIYF